MNDKLLICPWFGDDPPWYNSYLKEIDRLETMGYDMIVPRSPDGDAVMVVIPVEPKALMAMAAAKDGPDAARATQLLASLKWPGKPGLKTAEFIGKGVAFSSGQGVPHANVLVAVCRQRSAVSRLN